MKHSRLRRNGAQHTPLKMDVGVTTSAGRLHIASAESGGYGVPRSHQMAHSTSIGSSSTPRRTTGQNGAKLQACAGREAVARAAAQLTALYLELRGSSAQKKCDNQVHYAVRLEKQSRASVFVVWRNAARRDNTQKRKGSTRKQTGRATPNQAPVLILDTDTPATRLRLGSKGIESDAEVAQVVEQIQTLQQALKAIAEKNRQRMGQT